MISLEIKPGCECSDSGLLWSVNKNFKLFRRPRRPHFTWAGRVLSLSRFRVGIDKIDSCLKRQTSKRKFHFIDLHATPSNSTTALYIMVPRVKQEKSLPQTPNSSTAPSQRQPFTSIIIFTFANSNKSLQYLLYTTISKRWE